MIPLLGVSAEAGGVLYDPSAGEIRFGDRRITLTPSEAAVLGALDRADGAPLPAAELSRRLHGDRDVYGEEIVRHHVMRLRRKLAATPVRIEARNGFGYSLRLELQR